MSAKTDLIERIKRRFGWPNVKVEVDETTISNHIDYSRDKFIKYAVGHSTQEVWFTIMLSASQYLYDMPEGCHEVVNYHFVPTEFGGINTLFSVANMMFAAGMLDPLTGNESAGSYNLVSYHLARDFLETLEKYTPDEYNFKYHPRTNQLEIQPPPLSGNAFVYGDYTYDSPGFVLIQAFFLRSATLPDHTLDVMYEDLYNENQWLEDYAYARVMETLGLVRRKFANFTAAGTQGTSMDGDALVSEARDMMERLMDDLMDKESYVGGYITCG